MNYRLTTAIAVTYACAWVAIAAGVSLTDSPNIDIRADGPHNTLAESRREPSALASLATEPYLRYRALPSKPLQMRYFPTGRHNAHRRHRKAHK